jgi:hypothetical protein
VEVISPAMKANRAADYDKGYEYGVIDADAGLELLPVPAGRDINDAYLQGYRDGFIYKYRNPWR